MRGEGDVSTGLHWETKLKSILSFSSISRHYALPSGNTIRIRKKISTESLWNIADLDKYSTVPFFKNNQPTSTQNE